MNNEITIFVPDVYAIVNGEVIDSHRGVLDKYNPSNQLSTNEELKLKAIYMELISIIL